MIRVACQTPKDYCGAPLCEVNAQLVGMGNPKKLHATHEEAFNCYVAHLYRTGHVRVGGREFRRPEGGILVLTKVTRYGAEFRTGKKPQGKGGRRFMPASQKGYTPSGVIIG